MQIGRVDVGYTGNYGSRIIDANRLSSSYGKRTVEQMIQRAIEDENNGRKNGGVFYWNEEKASEVRTTRDQFPSVTNIRGLNPRITGENAVVKSKISAQTDTRQFKRWFGKSVVTEDGKPGGTPLVVYHGTNFNFTAFKKSEIGKTAGYGWGPGFYFTSATGA